MTPTDLYDARNSLGLTQAQMAERLFMTRVHYNALERGRFPITEKTAALVRSILE